MFQFTSGSPADPASYRDPFVTQEGEQVQVAYNTENKHLSEEGIVARLASFTVEESLSAGLAGIGKVNVSGKGKTVVRVLALAELKLAKYHPFVRAVAATTFGGFQSDVHVRNMDNFLRLNYGAAGGAPKIFRGSEARGFREELRRVVTASGAGPLDLIRDIKVAAEALASDDANLRVVALPAHSSNRAVGRQLQNDIILNALTIDQLNQLVVIKADFDVKRANLKRAEERLAKAQAANDPEAVVAAKEEVESRKLDLRTIDADALKFLQAFADTADALEKSQVDVVELQSCGIAASAPTIAAFDFLSRLSRFLSTRSHRVEVKGHAKAIFSQPVSGGVNLWIGGPDPSRGADQQSTTSLPLP